MTSNDAHVGGFAHPLFRTMAIEPARAEPLAALSLAGLRATSHPDDGRRASVGLSVFPGTTRRISTRCRGTLPLLSSEVRDAL